MKNSQNLAIVLLLISAALLTAMLLATMHQTSDEAVASVAVKQGDYIMATGQIASRYDALYAVDVTESRLIAYYINPDNDRLEILDTASLERAFR